MFPSQVLHVYYAPKVAMPTGTTPTESIAKINATLRYARSVLYTLFNSYDPLHTQVGLAATTRNVNYLTTRSLHFYFSLRSVDIERIHRLRLDPSTMESPEHINLLSFGQHKAWTATNDTVYVLWHGDVLGGDIDVIDSIIQSLPSDCPNLTLVQDVSNVEKFTSEARAKIIAHKDSQKLTLVVLVGASFHVRMIQLMINRAMRLLHTTTGRMECCDTMEQALECVDENRRQLRAKSPIDK